MYEPTPLETIEYHHSMLSDRVRTESYLQAIQKVVQPGDVVLDIGTGTGILAYFACMAGAGHVYAVEQGPVVELARRICQRNNYEDRVTFLPRWSTQVELPERVDVIVTETIGNFAYDEGILGWIADAKERLLVNGGRVVPLTLELVIVPVDDPEMYTLIDGFSRDCCTVDVSPARAMAASRLYLRDVRRDTFLSEPQCLTHVDMARVTDGDVGGEVPFVASRDGILYGIGGWFKAELIPGIGLTNAPPNRVPSWKQGLLPLNEPLAVRSGDRLNVLLQAKMIGGQCHWWWQVEIEAAEDRALQESPAGRVGTRQSRCVKGTTFTDEPEAGDVRPDPDQAPARGRAGDIDLFVLQSMDGVTSLGEIAGQLATRYPEVFTGYSASLRHVQDIAAGYSKAPIRTIPRGLARD